MENDYKIENLNYNISREIKFVTNVENKRKDRMVKFAE